MAIFYELTEDGEFRYIYEQKTVDPNRELELDFFVMDEMYNTSANEIVGEVPELCTHVMITAEEYITMSDMLHGLVDLGWDVRKIFEEVSTATYKANKRIEEADKLNENLKRIMKERANAKRGIPNKKEHSGFIVLRTEKTSKLLKTIYESDYRKTYRTTVQTPYDASIPEPEMRIMLQKELKWLCKRLGLKGIPKDKDVFDFVDKLDENKRFTDNVIYDTALRANYERGFWELDFYHTMSIYVPEELRKPQKR